MKVTRRHAIAVIGAALAAPSCGGGRSNAVRVGSKNFSENITIAEIYAGALERAGIPVTRRMNLGSTQIATAAMRRGDIDLYPEYTGTALIDVLHLPPMHSAEAIFSRIQIAYARWGLTWLPPSPVNDSQGLATTAALAQREGIRTLSQCARAASRLRLAAVPEFVSRADALPGLQRFYGGFRFKQVRTFEIGLQYSALVRGDAEVATAFTTDAQIANDRLVVLRDDKHFWPPYNVAPVVRSRALQERPRIRAALDRISGLLTDDAVRRLNVQVDVRQTDPADAAAAFLREHGV